MRQKFLPDFQTGERARLVLPDLVVHHPGHDGPEHNLLVLEAKKGSISARARKRDHPKPTGFLSVFQYRQTVFLEFRRHVEKPGRRLQHAIVGLVASMPATPANLAPVRAKPW